MKILSTLICFSLIVTPVVSQSKRKSSKARASKESHKPDKLDLLLADIPPPKPWKLINETDTIRYYYNTDAIRRDGTLVKIWVGMWPTAKAVKTGERIAEVLKRRRESKIETTGFLSNNRGAGKSTEGRGQTTVGRPLLLLPTL